MIINNFDIVRIAIAPAKADSPLAIYPDAKLPDPIAFERLKPVARRHSQILQPNGGIQNAEFG
jgi:hypothetical protein